MTSREKILVFVFMAISSVFLFSRYIYIPLKRDYSEAVDKRAGLEVRVDKLQIQNDGLKTLEQEVIETKEIIEGISKNYFESYSQEDIGEVLREISIGIPIEFTNISIKKKEPLEDYIFYERNESEIKAPIEIEYDRVSYAFQQEEQELEKEKIEDNLMVKVPKIGVQVFINGKYEGISEFIRRIENYEKKILIKEIFIGNKNDENEDLRCNISFDAIISPLPNKSKDKESNVIIGERFPFSSEKTEEEEFITDIFMILKPTSSDVESMVMGIDDDDSSNVIVSDSTDFLEGFLRVWEVNDEIRVSYGIGDEKFKENEGYVLNPKNEDVVMLRIISSPRNENDYNGVNMKMINDSSIDLIYEIVDDDEKERFVISEIKGSVLLND